MSDIDAVVSRWRKTKMLDSFAKSKNVSQKDVAILLENQRLYNETVTEADSDVSYHQLLAQFKRMSIPIVMRVMNSLAAPHLVRMKPIYGINKSADRFVLKACITDRGAFAPHSKTTDWLNVEAEITALTAQDIAMEIDLHVLDDLRINAGSVAFTDPTRSDLGERVRELGEAVEGKCGHWPSWVVASSRLSVLLKDTVESFEPSEPSFSSLLGVRFIGRLQWPDKPEQLLFENTLAPEHELLMGYHGSDTKGTYQFSPKLLLEALPKRRKKERVRQATLLAQFNKRLPKNGGNFYARMTVKAPD